MQDSCDVGFVGLPLIEIKHHEVPKAEREMSYCQDANGGSTALSLLSPLGHFSVPMESCIEIPPVVAFTFVGYCTNVEFESTTYV
jgi:hypothetical protein